jgi:hypothetical protein
MATVQIVYTNGRKAPAFTTYDPDVLARYKRYADTDPEIERVDVDVDERP